MFVLIRLIVLSIVIAITAMVFVFVIKSKKILFSPQTAKRVIVSVFVAFIGFLLVVFYPYESSFIRFDSMEQSINYSFYNFNLIERFNSKIYTAECDDTVFVVNEHGNTYRYTSIAKYDDGYGYCGDNVSVKIKANIVPIINDDFEGAADVSAIYNKNTDKTCYVVSLFDSDFVTVEEIFDISGEQLGMFKSADGEVLETYYSIESGAPKSEFTIVLYGQEFVLKL